MNLSTRTKAIGALVIAGILGGIVPLLTKVALKEFSSYQILFLRFAIASLLITPLAVHHFKTVTFKKVTIIFPAGLLFSGNVFLFVVGVQYTTSIVSQLLYLLTPVIVSFIGYFLLREKVSMRRVISMIICFGGCSLLILRSVQAGNLIHSIGSFQGNILILCGVISWSVYVVYTKRISKQFSPSSFLVANFITAFLVSCLGLIISHTSFIITITQLGKSSIPVIASLLTLASINSVLFFFLYQWSMKYVSAFIIASVTYLSPLSAAVFAIPFFGEELSSTLLISAVGIFLGSYLILSEKR